MAFNSRYLRYETNNSNSQYADYGEVSYIISDKLVNINMGGTGVILESVTVSTGYVPKIGDWVTVEWIGGSPIVRGGTGNGTGLHNINDDVLIVSPTDLAYEVVNGDHVATDSMQARHITADAIESRHITSDTIKARHITSDTIESKHIVANAIEAGHITSDTILSRHITSDTVESRHIIANAIESNHIKTNTIEAGHIVSNTIESRHIIANAINALHISANAIQTQHISSNTIQSRMIQSDAVEAKHIKAGSIVADKLVSEIIQSNHISANAIVSHHISSNSIISQHISSNVIESRMIKTDAVEAKHIKAGSINAEKITADAIQAIHISANAIQTEHISSNTIEGTHIKSYSIKSEHISANAIKAQHIESNAIVAVSIVSDSIQTRHISANAVTSDKIVANAIQANHISANAIQSNHISSNTIIARMIQTDAIESNHVKANAITAVKITSDAIQTNHISSNVIISRHIQADSINANHISANAVQANHISANSVQTGHISANTINASQLKADSVTAEKVQADAIQAKHISANAVQTEHISANSIVGTQIKAETINTDHLSVGTRKEGLLGQYFTHINGTNKFVNYKGFQIDPTINFSWGSGSPALAGQSDNFSVRWQGLIYAPDAGTYSFHATGDDFIKVTVNNVTIINQSATTEVTATIALNAGQWYPIVVEYHEVSGNGTAILKWTRPAMTKEVIPSKYFTQASTVIDGATIVTGSITASGIKVGTITAESGILADAVITTAHIKDGVITSAKIGKAEIKTANIASGNIENAHIKDATITHAKIISVDADTIVTGTLNAQLIEAGTITGDKISGNTITGNHILANSIDSQHIKAGAITTTELSALAITSDKIQAGAITSDSIRVGSIFAEHISTVGLDARLMSVYDSVTGETLIGGGYLRVNGLDVGVVQSDNLIANGLFLAGSSAYGITRDNPAGEALFGSMASAIGGNQIWKIDAVTGQKLKVIDIPAKHPIDIAIGSAGNQAYVTVEGDNTVVQIDLTQDALTGESLNMMGGPSRIVWTGDKLGDHKHFLVLNRDSEDNKVPDSLMVIDAPPHSVNGDLYLHHEIILGNNPYDMVIDENKILYITMASQGDVLLVDVSPSVTAEWKVSGRLPISAYGTDNYHGGLSGIVGLNEVVGGDASSQYDETSASGGEEHGGGMHSHGGYGAPTGSLKQYEPHGIALSQDKETIYVIDSKNNELVVVDKFGKAPYNVLTGIASTGPIDTGHGGHTGHGAMVMADTEQGQSPADARHNGLLTGGGSGTRNVRYRINVGDSPDYIKAVNGKLFITLEGGNGLAVINESEIIREIEADRAYYTSEWDETMAMREIGKINVRKIANVGAKPSHIEVMGNKIYVTLTGQNQIAVIDANTETVVQRINTGANPKGLAFTNDNRYIYVANYGGSGDMSFVYPKGAYIGDPFIGLEGGITYQGAHRWSPNRSDWTYDASGNIRSNSTVEFRINEPFLNEGGYAKLTTFGRDYQFALAEQDVTEVVNYSNGNNLLNVVSERMSPVGSGNTVFYPMNEWLQVPPPSNFKICQALSGGTTTKTNALPSTYSVYYGTNARIEFSGNTIPDRAWVEADYTAKNDIYFKSHNGSALVAIENGSSPNFNMKFEMDEFVPKFVVWDNQQTSGFTPTANGIDEAYEGLVYSTTINRAFQRTTVTSSYGSATSGNLIKVTDSDHMTEFATPSGNHYVQIDLGKKYMVGKIIPLHKHIHYDMGMKDRIYKNTKTQVSEDGVSWTTVYDSAIQGEYSECPYNPAMMDYDMGKVIEFPARPIRYVRDYANGWKSVDGTQSGTDSTWGDIQVFGDWEFEENIKYPANSMKAGQQIATNSKGFVSTDIQGASITIDLPVEFTTWWYMTYIVGPEYGEIAIDMPTAMNQSHFLSQSQSFYNNVYHRHIMPLPPSINIKEDLGKGVKAGKHKVVIKQSSGRVTLDRLRFEDYQYFTRSSLLIPTNTSTALFKRYKILTEQAKWYEGKGLQSTEGAYDEVRRNPDTGVPDKSVPIKYRFRILAELNADGSKEERGTAYFTSAIFETGKQSTHWRRSESTDIFPASRIEAWDTNQPHKTGIQHDQIANGAIRGPKILPSAIMDYHVSPYARISEFKLGLKHPTHKHDNKQILDSIVGWNGVSGNFGTGFTLSRGDHLHDDRYLKLDGGTITGAMTFQGITVNGNIIVNGTVDGVDIASLNTKVNGHIGVGGTAHHPNATTSLSGFMSNTDKTKIDGIQAGAQVNSITSVNGRTGAVSVTLSELQGLPLTGGTLTGELNLSNDGLGVTFNGGARIYKKVGTGLILRSNVDTNGIAFENASGNVFFKATPTSLLFNNEQLETVSGATSKLTTHANSTTAHANATSGANGFMSNTDKAKLDGIATGANNYSHPTGDGNLHVPATSTTNSTKVLKAGATAGSISWGVVDWSEISNKPVNATTTISGFMGNTDKVKLDGIQASAINQTTADGRYLKLTGGTLTGGLSTVNFAIKPTGDHAYLSIYARDAEPNIRSGYMGYPSAGSKDLTLANELVSGNIRFATSSGSIYFNSSVMYHAGNFNPANKSDITHVHSIATSTVDGFMGKADRIKLDDIATGANNYTHPTGDGNNHIPAGGSAGKFLEWSASGVATWDSVNWTDINGRPVDATQSVSGLMSNTDKAKLDGVQASAINQTTADGRYSLLTSSTISGTYTMTNTVPLVMKSSNKSWVMHRAEADNLIFAPSATSGNTDWDWTKQILFQPDGQVKISNTISGTNAVFSGTITEGGTLISQKYASKSHEGQGGSAHALATSSAHGFLSNTDKSKLDGIANNANNYSHPTGAGNNHIPTGGSAGQFLEWSSNGVAVWETIKWADVNGRPVEATSSVSGLISASDKAKIDGVQANAINKDTTDGLYSTLASSTITGTYTMTGAIPLIVKSSNKSWSMQRNTTDDSLQFIPSATSGNIDWDSNKIISFGTDGSMTLKNILTGTSAIFTGTVTEGGTLLSQKYASKSHEGTGGTAHALASTSAHGFLSNIDKAKLDAIANNANNYVHPTGAGNNHIPTGGSVGRFLEWSSNGVATWETVKWAEVEGRPVAVTTTVDGLMLASDKSKLNNIEANANNYSHPTGDGNLHVPATGTTKNNKVLKAGATAGSLSWEDVAWGDITGKPSTFTPSSHTHTTSEITDLTQKYYIKTEVDTLVANAGNIRAENENQFTNTNLFTNAGLSIKIQPSGNVQANQPLIQVNGVSGNSIFQVENGNRIVVNGDLVVTGQTVSSGTQEVIGDYTISGDFNLGGNATLGANASSQATVKGGLRVEGKLVNVGEEIQVGRVPLYGIGGDMQLQMDSLTYESILAHYWTFSTDRSAFPTVPIGATRKYKLMVAYSTSGTTNPTATLRVLQQGTTTAITTINLPAVSGDVSGSVRSFMSPAFTTSYTGHTSLEAKCDTTGTSLVIKYIELIAYDVYA